MSFIYFAYEWNKLIVKYKSLIIYTYMKLNYLKQCDKTFFHQSLTLDKNKHFEFMTKTILFNDRWCSLLQPSRSFLVPVTSDYHAKALSTHSWPASSLLPQYLFWYYLHLPDKLLCPVTRIGKTVEKTYLPHGRYQYNETPFHVGAAISLQSILPRLLSVDITSPMMFILPWPNTLMSIFLNL